MFVLGVTGGIGSGKTTVARILAAAGARVLDADQIVRTLYEGGEIPRRIAARFGAGALTPDGSVDRGVLARIVFADRGARRDLEAIVHPAVRGAVEKSLAQWRREGYEGLAVVDAALLVEASPPYPLDALLVVVASEEIRETRLEQRGVSRGEFRRRIAAQSSEEERRERADFVILNDGSLQELERRVHGILGQLRGDGGGRSG